MDNLKAVIFDLYGTLLSSPPPTLHREIPRVLGVRTRAWLDLVREKLLTRPFASAEEMAHFICEELAPGADIDREARCVEVITGQLDHVAPLAGIESLLSFLRGRGYALGLLSNLSSSYKEPLERFGLSRHFDAAYFSCDEGLRKPDPETYRETARRLGADPAEVLFVGDSVPNDVEAPAALGMQTLLVGASQPGALAETHLVGLLDLSGNGTSLLLESGREAEMPGGPARVLAIEPVADDEQGRYNLVYRVESDSAESPVSYVKRFLLPESAYVEELAYRVHALVGLPTCKVAIVGEREPLLAISEARGRKYADEMSEAIAWELGRHFAFAYVFSNADIRPRNAFIHDAGDRPEVTMVDLEHCFFNLAIDPSGLEDPLDPECLDRTENLPVAKQVLTDRAMRRARRSFVQEESISAETYAAYQSGFRDFFRHMSGMKDEIVAFLDERVHCRPYLVLGTHSYRRAMASVDVREIGDRLGHDPDQVMSRFC